jgi:MFS transporter, DHA1 family, multidrug resistance protein
MPAAADGHSWRRNLAGLWVATLTAIFGVSFASPFIPLFFSRELSIKDPHQLAFWSGLAPAALGVSLAISSPIWGMVADRVGLKPMLIRAMVGGAFPIALIALAHTPLQVTGLEFLYGAVSGFGPIAITMAARDVPRERVGFGIGIVQSANSIGQSIGPFLGSLLAIAVGLRGAFVVGGMLILAAVIPVLTLIRESRVEQRHVKRLSVLAAIRVAPPGSLRALGALTLAQVLIWTSGTAALPLVALRVLALSPTNAAVVTGVAFALASLSTAVVAVSYSPMSAKFGYRWLAAAAALIGAFALAGVAIAPSIAIVVVAFAVFGLSRGVLIPAVPSMIGLEAPPTVIATVMGISGSAMAIGIAAGPLLGGAVAALSSVSTSLMVAALMSFVLSGVIVGLVREPTR